MPTDYKILTPPPRAIPKNLRLIMTNRFILALVAAGFIPFFTLALFMGALADFSALNPAWLNPANAKGTVERIEKTDCSENEQPINNYFFTFSVPNEQTVKGHSYSSKSFDVNAPVDIEYLPKNPQASRIKDTRSKPLPAWPLAILLVPFGLGILFIRISILSGKRICQILRDGKIAQATITLCKIPEGEDDFKEISLDDIVRNIDAQPATRELLPNAAIETDVKRWKGAPIFTTFVFTTPEGEQVLTSCDVAPKSGFGLDPTEPVIYDPKSPRDALILNDLPVVLSAQGDWLAHPKPGTYFQLALVALCFLASPLISLFIWHFFH